MRGAHSMQVAMLLSFVLLAVLLLLAPARAQTRSEEAASPMRIISLLPSMTETLCAVGGCDRLVGVDRFSNWPPEVKRLPALGGLDDARVEAIVRLKPDLVLLSHGSKLAGRLAQLGIRTRSIRVETHADVLAAVRAMATLIGRPQAAAAVEGHIEEGIEAARRAVPEAMRGMRVYYEISDGPYAAGSGSFIDETFRRVGLRNAIPPELGPYPRLNPEYVLRAEPELVFASALVLDAMRRRPGWSSMRALQTGRHCGFDEAQTDLLVRPGPRLGEGAMVLARCLQKASEHIERASR